MKDKFRTSSWENSGSPLRQADLRKTNGWVGGEVLDIRRCKKGTTIALKQGAIVTMRPENLRHREIRFRARQELTACMEEGKRFKVRLAYKGMASNISEDYTGITFFAEQVRPLGSEPWPPAPRHKPS